MFTVRALGEKRALIGRLDSGKPEEGSRIERKTVGEEGKRSLEPLKGGKSENWQGARETSGGGGRPPRRVRRAKRPRRNLRKRK